MESSIETLVAFARQLRSDLVDDERRDTELDLKFEFEHGAIETNIRSTQERIDELRSGFVGLEEELAGLTTTRDKNDEQISSLKAEAEELMRRQDSLEGEIKLLKNPSALPAFPNFASPSPHEPPISLPIRVYQEVFSHATTRDVIMCSLVSKSWGLTLATSGIWKHVYRSEVLRARLADGGPADAHSEDPPENPEQQPSPSDNDSLLHPNPSGVAKSLSPSHLANSLPSSLVGSPASSLRRPSSSLSNGSRTPSRSSTPVPAPNRDRRSSTASNANGGDVIDTHKHYRLAIGLGDFAYQIAVKADDVETRRCTAAETQDRLGREVSEDRRVVTLYLCERASSKKTEIGFCDVILSQNRLLGRAKMEIADMTFKMDAIDQAKRANAVDTARLKAKLAYYKRVTDEIEQQRISDMHTLRFLSNQLTDLNQQLASKQTRISAHSSRRNSREIEAETLSRIDQKSRQAAEKQHVAIDKLKRQRTILATEVAKLKAQVAKIRKYHSRVEALLDPHGHGRGSVSGGKLLGSNFSDAGDDLP